MRMKRNSQRQLTNLVGLTYSDWRDKVDTKLSTKYNNSVKEIKGVDFKKLWRNNINVDYAVQIALGLKANPLEEDEIFDTFGGYDINQDTRFYAV